jgi:hypothetical protein
MRQLKLAIPLLVAILTAGCDEVPSVVSLLPIYDARTLVFEPALAGSWLEDGSDSHDTFAFEQSADGSTYRLRITEADEHKTVDFDAAVVQLGGVLFLDLCSKDTGFTDAPAHVIVRLRMQEGRLGLQEINNKWLAETLAAGGALPHIKTNNKVVITATTIDLQRFLQLHATDAFAFPEDGADAVWLKRVGENK